MNLSAPGRGCVSSRYRGAPACDGSWSRAPVAPTMIAGATDSRFFRRRGVDAYGFSPFTLSADDAGGIHGADERIPVEGFLRGCEMMKRVVAALVLAEVDSVPPAAGGAGRRAP